MIGTVEYGTKPSIKLQHMHVYNGDLWVELARATGTLTRTQVRELMKSYSPAEPEPVVKLWKTQHPDKPLRSALLERCAFNYRGNPDEIGTYDPAITALSDIDELCAFGTLSSRLSKSRLLDGSYQYEEFFTATAPGILLAQITSNLFMDSYNKLQLVRMLSTHRLLASNHPLGDALLELE